MVKRYHLLPYMLGLAALVLVFKLGGLWQGIGGAQAADEVKPPAASQPAPAAAKPADSTAPKPAPAAAQRQAADSEGTGEGSPVERFDPATASKEELRVLQRLSDRRDEIAKAEREIDLRGKVLAATEARIENKLNELKSLKAEIDGLLARRTKAEQEALGRLVQIYEAMKPKDAARIFEKLGMPVLLDVVERMREAKTAPIMASMDPEKAEELTSAIAQRRALAKVGPQDTVPTAVPPAAETARPVPTGAR